MILPFRNFWQADDGAGTIDGLMWTLATLMVGSLAIDGSNAWRGQTKLQTTADATALAAAATLGDGVKAAHAMAQKVADMNLVLSTGDSLLLDEDITFGNYAQATGFVADAEPLNAAQVDLHRLKSRGTGVETLVMGLMGKDAWDISTRAIAVRRGATAGAPECEGGMLIAQGTMHFSGSDVLQNHMCAHGETALYTGAGSLFDATVRLSSPPSTTQSIGGFGPNNLAQSEIVLERSLPPRLLEYAKVVLKYTMSLDSDVNATTHVPAADWMQFVQLPIFAADAPIPISYRDGPITIEPTDDLSGQILYVRGDVSLRAGTLLQDTALIVTGTIDVVPVQTTDRTDDPTLQDNAGTATDPGGTKDDLAATQTTTTIVPTTTLKGSLIVATTVGMDAPLWLGSKDACQDGSFSTYVIAQNNIHLGASGYDFDVQGAMAISAFDQITTSGGPMGNGMYLESYGDQRHYDPVDLIGCPTALNSPFDLTVTPSVAGGRSARLVR